MWRTAIIGFGSSAEYFHLPSIFAAREFALIAAFDPVADRRRVATRMGIPQVFDVDQFEHLLRALAIQVLVVASPNSEHVMYAHMGIAAGATVIVEKPVCLSGSRYAELDEAARRADAWLIPFHNRLYDNDQQIVQAAVLEGQIGKVVRVDITCAQTGPWQDYAVPEFDPTWRSQRRYWGGVLNDWGPHLLHQCIRLLSCTPKLDSVWVHTCNGEDVEAIVSLTLRALDVSARILVSAVEPSPPEKLRVVGTSGCVIVRGTDMEGTVHIHGCRGSGDIRYLNRPDSGSAIYLAAHDALTNVCQRPLELLSAEAQIVYSLLGEAREMIKGQY